MLIIAMNHIKNSKCTLMSESFLCFFEKKKEKFELIPPLFLSPISINTLLYHYSNCMYIYERICRERTFRNSRSHNCLSRTIVVFPLVFRLNTFSLFFLFPTVHFLSSSFLSNKKEKREKNQIFKRVLF